MNRMRTGLARSVSRAARVLAVGGLVLAGAGWLDARTACAGPDGAKELAVQAGTIPTQKIVWKPRSATGNAPPPVGPRGPGGCPAVTESVANCYNSVDVGGEITLQLGMVQGEGFGSTYIVPNAATAFPIEVTLVEFLAATVASGIGPNIRLGYRIEVWDGDPGQAGSSVAFSVDSTNDSANEPDLPPDISLQRVSGQTCDDPTVQACAIVPGLCQPMQASAAKVQFSVDPTADAADRMIVYNTSGTGKFSIVVYMRAVNAPGAGCSTLNSCNNAYLATEGTTVSPCSPSSNGTNPTYITRNWLFAVPCSGGCSGGFHRFDTLPAPSLTVSCAHPSRDVLQQVTYITSVCATGACCASDGSCSVGPVTSCVAPSSSNGINSICGINACPTGACCFSSGFCSTTTSAGCVSGTFQGTTSVCNPNPCPQPTGACCTLGACAVATSANCTGGGGTYQGNNVLCANVSCPAPTGACCFGTGCLPATSTNCQSAGGIYQGNTSACTPSNTCPTGACCVTSTGGCTTTTPAGCTAVGSVYTDNTACSTTVCPVPTGACCTTTSFCLPGQTQSACIGIPGFVWKGAGTTCAPDTCASAGICCRGVACTTGFTQANCVSPGGTVGAAWVSTANCNTSSTTTPCCFGDFNKNNVRNVNDIFDYLSAWFNASPFAKAGGNGTGTPIVADIFSFLSAWFGPAC